MVVCVTLHNKCKKHKEDLPTREQGRIDSSAPLDRRKIFPLLQSFTTTDILFLSELNSRMSSKSYCTIAPLKLISAKHQTRGSYSPYVMTAIEGSFMPVHSQNQNHCTQSICILINKNHVQAGSSTN